MKLEQFNFVKKRETNMSLILLGALIGVPIAIAVINNLFQNKKNAKPNAGIDEKLLKRKE
jgi:hypothetical protein